jgi:hypothetical protein
MKKEDILGSERRKDGSKRKEGRNDYEEGMNMK